MGMVDRDLLWVTRSQPGAQRLASTLEDAGYPCLVAPVLRIEPRPAESLPARISVAVALSEHAVQHAPVDLWARAETVIAVGARTAAVLAERGVHGSIPQVASSEGLLSGPLAPWLAAPEAVAAPVALVSGYGGRTVLRDALRDAGLDVCCIEVYERCVVAEPPAGLDRVRALVVSSGDGFSAASRLWCPGDQQPDVPVFAPSQRVAAMAARLGFSRAYDCAGADPQSVLAQVQRVLAQHEND
ncbi:MAG: uroporphyrinogen-III synthase [Pseudomonadota bacterium]